MNYKIQGIDFPNSIGQMIEELIKQIKQLQPSFVYKPEMNELRAARHKIPGEDAKGVFAIIKPKPKRDGAIVERPRALKSSKEKYALLSGASLDEVLQAIEGWHSEARR